MSSVLLAQLVMVYDTTILNEHPFWVILGPVTNFWVRQEGGETGEFFVLIF